MTFVVIDLVLLKEEPDPIIQLPSDLSTTTHRRIPVNLDCRWINLDTPFGTVDDCFLIQLCIVKQCLGGNTSPVEADSTKSIAFYTRGLKPKLGCANCRDVATWASADDDQVVMLALGHGILNTSSTGLPQETYAVSNHPIRA